MKAKQTFKIFNYLKLCPKNGTFLTILNRYNGRENVQNGPFSPLSIIFSFRQYEVFFKVVFCLQQIFYAC